MGDLGTLLPFMAALAKEGYISIVPAMFFAGLFNITSAIHWDIPMPVQPMKAIATVALTSNGALTASSVLTAGILTALTVMLLGLTRGIEILHHIIPMPVVLGLQVGLGFRMITKAFKMVTGTRRWFGMDSIITGIVACLTTLCFRHNKRVPTALIVFLLGLLLAIIIVGKRGGGDGSWPHDGEWPVRWTLSSLTGDDWKNGFIHGAIPQIPLTTLNSVIAVTRLAHDLFPQKVDDISRPGVAISVGLMNILGCAFGAMPACHGAGGLASQHAFGARGGLSIFILGSCKIMVALLFGGSAILTLLKAFPNAILGALLGISGLELALNGVLHLPKERNNDSEIMPENADGITHNQNSDKKARFRKDCLICLATAGTTVAVGSTALGCVAGLLMAMAESDLMKRIATGTVATVYDEMILHSENEESTCVHDSDAKNDKMKSEDEEDGKYLRVDVQDSLTEAGFLTHKDETVQMRMEVKTQMTVLSQSDVLDSNNSKHADEIRRGSVR